MIYVPKGHADGLIVENLFIACETDWMYDTTNMENSTFRNNIVYSNVKVVNPNRFQKLLMWAGLLPKSMFLLKKIKTNGRSDNI
jgi:hypothetical protein